MFTFFQVFPKGFFMLFIIQFGGQVGFNGAGFKPVIGFLILIATLNLVVGTVGALHQTSLKRLLIYSSMANLSLIFYVMVANTAIISENSVIYLVLYLATTATFVLPLLKESNEQSFQKFSTRWSIVELSRGLSAACKLQISVALLNLSGLPPFAMFFGKTLMIVELIEKGFFFSVFLILIFSTVTVAYTIGILRKLWFETSDRGKVALKNALSFTVMAPILLVQFTQLTFAGQISLLVESVNTNKGFNEKSYNQVPFDWEFETIMLSNLYYFKLIRVLVIILATIAAFMALRLI